MKKYLLSILAITLALSLCACGLLPLPVKPEEAPPVQNSAPAEEPQSPAPETPAAGPADKPAPSAPAESPALPEKDDVPEETAPSPEAMEPYLQEVKSGATPIYGGPGGSQVGTVGEPGVFTIVEEQEDAEGKLWGRLKSGAGWLNLTELRAPVLLDACYAGEELPAGCVVYVQEGYEMRARVLFTTEQHLRDVELCMLDVFEDLAVSDVLYTLPEMHPEQPFMAEICFFGDFTTYGLRFKDEAGKTHCFTVMESLKDGSLDFGEIID